MRQLGFHVAKSIIVVATVSFVALSALGAGVDVDQSLQQSDQSYRNRDMTSDAAELAAAQRQGADPYELKWRWARHHFAIADASDDADIKEEHGKIGWDNAREAIALRPDGVQGHFWGAAALGEYSQGVGILKALAKGLAPKFEEHCKNVIRIDPNYEMGGGARAFGRYYYMLPWPKRDLKRSIGLLDEAIRRGPNKTRNHFYLAESLVADDQKGRAAGVLQQCVASADVPEDPVDNRRFRLACKQLLGHL